MDTNEPFLAKIHTIYVFECTGTNHFETKQTSPMPRLGCVSANPAFAGRVSWSCDLLKKNVLAESPSGDENQSSTSPFPYGQRRTIGAVKQAQPMNTYNNSQLFGSGEKSLSGSTETLCVLVVCNLGEVLPQAHRQFYKRDTDAHLSVFARGFSNLADQAWLLHLTCNRSYLWSSVQPFVGFFKLFFILCVGVPNGAAYSS